MRNGIEGTWKAIAVSATGKIKQIAADKLGVFGINTIGEIVYRVGTKNKPESTGSDWQKYVNFSIYLKFRS